MLKDTLETFQQPRDLERENDLKGLKEEAQRIIFIKAILNEIKKSSNLIVDGLGEGISVNNLDEIAAALHNELKENTKLLVSTLLFFKNSQQKSLKDLGDITEATAQAIIKGFESSKPLDTVSIKNLGDITIPDQLNVKNLKDLQPYFEGLEKTIKGIVLELPVPQVTVTVPEVRVEVPETQINVPETNLEPILDALQDGLKKLRQNKMSNPVFVRMTDLSSLLSKLDEVIEASRNVMLGFPGSIRIQNATGGNVDFNQVGLVVASTVGNGKTTVTTAGTRVTLSSSKSVKSVVIKALSTNTGFIYVGDSGVSAANGYQLKQGETTSMNITNLNTINIDSSVNGEGVTYMWVN